MKKILLNKIHKTKNYKKHYALVSDEDFEKVNEHNWHIRPHCRTIYAQAVMNGKIVPMHRFITGVKGIDHKDGNGLNNQRCNLRKATNSQNGMNMRKQLGTSSKYKGVHKYCIICNGKKYYYWRARIMCEGDRLDLGNFKTEKEAGQAYNKKAKELFGEFARF